MSKSERTELQMISFSLVSRTALAEKLPEFFGWRWIIHGADNLRVPNNELASCAGIINRMAASWDHIRMKIDFGA